MIMVTPCCVLVPVGSFRGSTHCYEGCISSRRGVDYHIKITSPCLLKNARFECDWRLRNLMRGHEDLLRQRLAECSTIDQLVLELRSLVQRLEGSGPVTAAGSLDAAPSYVTLMADLDRLGWTRVVAVSPDLSSIQLKARDNAGREHILKVELPSQYPDHAPILTADTPIPFRPTWTAQSNLVQLLQQFGEWLGKFQGLWEELDEVDRECWVLEPESPTKACVYRRIVLSDHLSLHMVLDHASPRAPPQVNFLGADHAISPLMTQWASALHHWNLGSSLCSNLRHVLSISIPGRPEMSRQEDWEAECAICYAYRFEGHTPSVVCDHRQCGQKYHNQCLHDWLRTLPTVTKYFSKLTGECPFCGHAISCSASPQTLL